MGLKYEITIANKLPERWNSWLESVETVYDEERGQTTIHIEVADQTALHGVLERIRDLHLHLISLQQKEAQTGEATQQTQL